MTKAGRICEDYSDYSPEWIRKSVARSLKRFATSYLDVVSCQDVEFVNFEETLQVVETLYELSHSGVIRCVEISGADIDILEAGQLTLQNTWLEKGGLNAFGLAGVKAVCNSSPLAIRLLRNVRVPVGALVKWHPAPPELRAVCQEAAESVQDQGDSLVSVALRFSISRAQKASQNGLNDTTITGIISESDLEENVQTAKQILQKSTILAPNAGINSPDDLLFEYGDLDEEAVSRDSPLYEGARTIRGRWLDYDFFWPQRPKAQVQAQRED
ncbi:hypothetical protein AYO20_02793 [Fonsecaea nubica]|uniref:NADP-dependent oxidoreductase domain-containing protein n=1 Tax=Fonsecaea nubica TaxID=856822 RepID=A0A178D6V8_9EURO|nr:hypothetical protein AYO20_02793 [Fonsecaea nubica]OAL37960.1 hypothetical protein AYO20_02793 [Fonsecaea nubica]